MFKSRGFDISHTGDLNGNKEKHGLYSRGSSPHSDRVYKSQQNLSQYDYANSNVSRPTSNGYVPSSHEKKISSRLSPMHYKNQLRSFDSDASTINKDGRQNSDKMLESRVDVSILSAFRLPADGSSRQNSFCLQSDDTISGKNTFDSGGKGSYENIENLSSRCKELETSCRIEKVRSDRLEEHVKVLNRSIKKLEDTLEQSDIQLKKERMKAAKLEKSLEKAQVDITSIIAPSPSGYGKVEISSLNLKMEQKTYNQDSIISGTDESPYSRRNLVSAKDGTRNTPSKKKIERQYSWKHLTEKGPTIYMG